MKRNVSTLEYIIVGFLICFSLYIGYDTKPVTTELVTHKNN